MLAKNRSRTLTLIDIVVYSVLVILCIDFNQTKVEYITGRMEKNNHELCGKS